MTYLIEYLGEFELILETILDYESGTQMGSFDAKKPPSKISCLGTFKLVTSNRGAEGHVLKVHLHEIYLVPICCIYQT
jgi:hypothetical protein